MEWQDHLNIGEPDVDGQRRQLFEMVNDLKAKLHTNTMFEAMGKCLKFIVAYANEHFKAEEVYIQAIGFPRSLAHKDRHDELTRGIQAILLKIKQDKHISPSQLLQFMSDWLLNHTLVEDLKIRQFQDQAVKLKAAAKLQEYADARSAALEALKQVNALFSKETITEQAYLDKKKSTLDSLVLLEAPVPMEEITERIELIEMFLSQSLIDEQEERTYKQKLFENVDLDAELEKRAKPKAKINYLKSLLVKDLITEETFNTYSSCITGESSCNKPPDQDVVHLL